MRALIAALSFTMTCMHVNGFAVNKVHQRDLSILRAPSSFRMSPLRMSDPMKTPDSTTSTADDDDDDFESPMEIAQREQTEKARRADELRAQEKFMVRGTGKHDCKVCDYQFDEGKGDINTIGGTIQPGTAFGGLPANWRCPTCRASKDNFEEVVEEIPGFEVNQGYGFGTNSLTAGQKNGLIFGGLGFFFLLFLSGYALS